MRQVPANPLACDQALTKGVMSPYQAQSRTAGPLITQAIISNLFYATEFWNVLLLSKSNKYIIIHGNFCRTPPRNKSSFHKIEIYSKYQL